jgi:hypothetical protein
MRFLIISHAYFPANDPRSFRWTEVSETLVQMGIEIDVITASNRKKLVTKSTRGGVKIFRVFDPIFLISYLGKKNKNGGQNFSHPKFSITIVISKILTFLRWPDYAWLWIFFATFIAKKLITRKKYDAIISVSNPFSSHVVAYLIKRRVTDSVWMCDYGDPFSFESSYPSNNHVLYRNFNFLFEKRVLNTSDIISVTNEPVIRKFQEHFKVPVKKFKVVPPLINNLSENISLSIGKSGFNLEATNIVFSGTLYSKIRNPVFLLELIVRIKDQFKGNKINLHFFGDIGDCEEIFAKYHLGLNKWLFIHGSVKRHELYKYLANSNFLVNIGNNNNFQLPSKIYEYMATGLPILNIVSSDADLTVPILNKYNSSLTLNSGNGFSKTIDQMAIDFLNSPRPVDYHFVNKILAQNSTSAITQQYLYLINQCILKAV